MPFTGEEFGYPRHCSYIHDVNELKQTVMRQYKNGYAEKINYWMEKLKHEAENGNCYSMEYPQKRLNYFIAKHAQWMFDNKVGLK